jgi:hypothetical protein
MSLVLILIVDQAGASEQHEESLKLFYFLNRKAGEFGNLFNRNTVFFHCNSNCDGFFSFTYG